MVVRYTSLFALFLFVAICKSATNVEILSQYTKESPNGALLLSGDTFE